jgi:site-specific recombinase XerD
VTAHLGPRTAPRFTDSAIWQEYRFHLAVERQLRPTTLATYADHLDRWGRFLGRRPWQKATAGDLHRFNQRRVSTGQVRTGRPLSANLRRTQTVAVARFYAWAHRAGHLDRDPMVNVALGRRAPTSMPRNIALSDVRSLLVWVQGDERAEVAVSLAYYAGLRVSEIAALRIEDIRLRGDRPTLQVIDSKYGRSRVVPLVPALHDTLAAYLAQRAGAGPLLTRRHPADGRPMTGQTVSDTIRQAMRAAKIKARPHDLRHTFATELLQATRGEGLLTVSKLLGHRSPDFTLQTYGSGYKGELDDVAALLPDPLGGDRHA